MTPSPADLDTALIEPARSGDGARVAAYMAAIVAEDLDTLASRTIRTAEQFEDMISEAVTGKGLFLIAKAGDEVVGMLNLAMNQRRGRTHVADCFIIVAKAWRGQGVGRRLMEAAIHEVQSWPEACRIQLEVVPWNDAAIALYESLGFQLEARTRKSINLRGQPEDMFLMALVW